MKKFLYLGMVGWVMLSACSGADTVIKKRWQNTENTLSLQDITSKDFTLMDAGARLEQALEISLDNSSFIVAGKNARYILKYKILNFEEGSRAMRIATLGLSDSARSTLKVKAALFREGTMVGGWAIHSWVKGGITGGSEDDLFSKAAEEIVQHLNGK